ncbi:imidazole glycerol phosphate synthase subunit HisH [Candidatus Daviesbacteria bacterium]|nr:imidazole glycerol phosphate synthase subunit HisH [Candidatus Daviesbacteria bacterium]
MIVIIDYGVGNLASVKNALDKLGAKSVISENPEIIKGAKALILPGVGAAGQGMRNLKKQGLDKVVIDEINKGKPFLGICLGMQLLFEESEEGNVKCLGVLEGSVKKFKKMKKIPQIGWNQIDIEKESPFFKDIKDKSYFYFVNSFYCLPKDKEVVTGVTSYGERFSSIVQKDNVIGVQFHPERSGKVGFRLLENFVKGATYVS